MLSVAAATPRKVCGGRGLTRKERETEDERPDCGLKGEDRDKVSESPSSMTDFPGDVLGCFLVIDFIGEP